MKRSETLLFSSLKNSLLSMGFGSFELLCQRANIPLCPLVGPYESSVDNLFGRGIIAGCYARSIVLANTMIFNIGTVFLHFGTILMIGIAVYTIYGKYTAVGRREMLDFFYMCFLLEIWALVVDAGVAPATSPTYPWFVAIECGLASGTILQLLLSGLVGYQLWEDGSFKSVWSMRVSSFLWGLIVFLVAIFTFNGGENHWPDTLNPKNTAPLMGVLYVVNLLFLFLYICMAFYLSAVLIKNFWATCSYALALFFFVSGQLLMFAFGRLICSSVRHYIDGIFFGTFCNLCAFLMVYRAYDTLTAEDLEFTVSPRDANWDTKSMEAGESIYALSNYNLQVPN